LSSLLRQNGILHPEDEVVLGGKDPRQRAGVTPRTLFHRQRRQSPPCRRPVYGRRGAAAVPMVDGARAWC